MKSEIEAILQATSEVHRELLGQADVIESLGRCMADALRQGRRIYVMGNGGSAADSQHLAGEMVGRFLMEDRDPLPCQAFSTDTSVITSIANDCGIEQIFVKQVQAFVNPGDVVIGISTSGSSKNVNLALVEAKRLGARTLGLTGRRGGDMHALCDLCLRVPADETPRIQEGHQTVIHILCYIVEQTLFSKRR